MTGLTDGTFTEIVSGLDATDEVVKANGGSLSDEQPVQVPEPEKTAKPSVKK